MNCNVYKLIHDSTDNPYKGGMLEFEQTGIYPEYLLFNLPGTRQSWRIQIRQTPQEGVLKSKGEILYEYSFNGNSCKFRKRNFDGSLSEWREPDAMFFEMRDYGNSLVFVVPGFINLDYRHQVLILSLPHPLFSPLI